MKLGMVGLGRMGGNIVRRLVRNGHQCVVFDQSPAAVQTVVAEGAAGGTDLADLVINSKGRELSGSCCQPAKSPSKRWATRRILTEGDIVIDGGNSFYKDDIRRAKTLKAKGIHFVDCGTSGGVWGLERGYCMMIGGDKDVGRSPGSDLRCLAPGAGTFRPRRTRRPRSARRARLSPLRSERRGSFRQDDPQRHRVRPHAGLRRGLQHPAGRRFRGIAAGAAYRVRSARHRRGLATRQRSRSWLLDLTAIALAEDPELERYSGFVEDSGEGRWTIMAAVEEAVPARSVCRALCALPVARQGGLLRQDSLSHAQAVRRPCRTEENTSPIPPDDEGEPGFR